MTPDLTSVIEDVIQSVESLYLTKELQSRIKTHKINLTNLAASMLLGGHEIEQIRLIVSKLLDSFRDELVRALFALQEHNDVK